MALTIKQQSDELDLFHFDTTRLLDNPAAQHAHRRGLLTAKSSAHRQSELLARTGLVLLACVLAVSFLHIFHTLASYVPANITPVEPPAWLWHTSAALLTLTIDAIALYIVLVGNVAAFAGHRHTQRLVIFFYVLTGLLNGVFFINYVPGAPEWIASALDAGFATVIIILMTLLVPISIIAVKQAMQIAETARLKLLVECETLRGLMEPPATDDTQAPPAVATKPQRKARSQPHGEAHHPATHANTTHDAAQNIVNQTREACEPSPMPKTTAHPTPSTGNAPHEALHSSTLGISGISEAPATKPVVDRVCPRCGTALTAAQYGAARRWGHCKTCKEA